MTNYNNYPIHRLNNACFVICFGSNSYCWCLLNKENLYYLINSDYIDSAFYIDFCQFGFVIHRYTVDEFRHFHKTSFIDLINEKIVNELEKGNR